ncbi:acyl transferase/acyl hydrolase/lysophospholipase [Sporodiniella umbellata]|nr:acyl transferase/acyl hydrolase/lysophospholipase [Sporodiniella umbellata]
MVSNPEEALKKTTDKIVITADKSGTRRLDRKTPSGPLKLDYVNETHVADFMNALDYDPTAETISARSDSFSGLASSRSEKSRSKKKLKKQEAAKPSGISFSILRYPLVLIIGSIIVIELATYISLRQIVRLSEKLISWRGKKKRLRESLRQARTYKEWCEAADGLDKHLENTEWKKTIPFAYYDYRLLRKVVQHLKTYRESDTEEGTMKMIDVLYVCLKQNFAGIENVQMYSHTYLGTKTLIEEYVEEVTLSIEAVAKSPHVPLQEKKLAFKLYSKNYGRSALCLSGGAGFAYYHLGVIRALLDRGLIPPIVTGTSAGSLMGAIACTRSNEELNEIINPRLADRIRICSDSWTTRLARLVKTGSLFDVENWCREAMWFCQGSMTFKEAYEKTGRIFNVSVVPHEPHSPPKLLNYITAPDCVIWSAVLASSAIPGILPAVVLMQKKGRSEHLIPYNYGHKFKDGSLRTDIPTFALNTQFNVNYTIVSQVNPHIHLFFYGNQGSPGHPVIHRKGNGWRGGFLASTLEQMLKLDLTKWMKVIRQLKLLPNINDQDWSSVFLQKFDGNVTILPKTGMSDWLYTVADPDEARLKKVMNGGQLRTWPVVSMISNRMRLETAIETGRRALKEHQDSSDAGSEDESDFIEGRRASMPTTSVERTRRRRFMAQFRENKPQGVQGELAIGETNPLEYSHEQQ